MFPLWEGCLRDPIFGLSISLQTRRARSRQSHSPICCPHSAQPLDSHLVPMVSVKRKRTGPEETDSEAEYSEVSLGSEDEIDISSALTGKRPRVASKSKTLVIEDEEDLQDFIRESIAKRDVKEGTELLKKTKGRTKIVKGELGGGSFQSMGTHLFRGVSPSRSQDNIGLYPWILRSLTLQGFRIPTPIQRLSIPALLTNPPRDLVGMARTGSGKSLAYMVPLVQRLGGRHSATFGARALILLPVRELALQILKVGKELARGWHAGEGDHAGDAQDTDTNKKGQSLRWGLVVGGESLDEQFEMISNNPDVYVHLLTTCIYRSPAIQDHRYPGASSPLDCRNESRP